jgi:sulfhydrogenase subunit beta (sulfur reductase)
MIDATLFGTIRASYYDKNIKTLSMLSDLQMVIIQHNEFERLISALKQHGYSIVAPTKRGSAIVYEEILSSTELPIGWIDEQEPGVYRLKQRSDRAYFGYNVGAHSWKKILFTPLLKLFSAKRSDEDFSISSSSSGTDDSKIPESHSPAKKYAFLGVRSCELYALKIQDKVFIGGQYVDPFYKSLREQTFIIAVNCSQAGGTCFCASMNTGPKVEDGYDLALTEVMNEKEHYFVVDIGSERGNDLLREVPHSPAEHSQREVARQIVEETRTHMGRVLDTINIKELLYGNLEHKRWDEVAKRCLSCANCTMVCPTCFCSTVEDVTDLTGDHAERWRKWDSCFTMDFSYIHGGSTRSSVKSRYRQWMTHKLASWIDQFGTSGCVGCGRCITWCPVGIDITEETRALRTSQQQEQAITLTEGDK